MTLILTCPLPWPIILESERGHLSLEEEVPQSCLMSLNHILLGFQSVVRKIMSLVFCEALKIASRTTRRHF